MAYKLTKRDVQMLSGVHPDIIKVVNRLAEITTMPFRITEGLRTVARQRILVRDGFSRTMNSRHLTGHAIDVVPFVDVNKNGKVETAELYKWNLYYPLAQLMKQAARDVGVRLEWGGDWVKFRDGPHWQLPRNTHYGLMQIGADPSDDSDIIRYASEAPDEPDTDTRYHMRGVVPGVASGTAATVTLGLPTIVEVLIDQQNELTSGDVARVVVAISIIIITACLAYRMLSVPKELNQQGDYL